MLYNDVDVTFNINTLLAIYEDKKRDCPGSTENSSEFNSNIEIKNIRVCCSYSNHEYHLVLQWSNPSFNNKTVKNLVVGFYSPSESGCFKLHKNTTEFEFTRKIGYNSENNFQFTIFTEPIAHGTELPVYSLLIENKLCGPSNIGDCNDVKSTKIFTTIVSPRTFLFSNEIQITILIFLSLITFGAIIRVVLKIRRQYAWKNPIPYNEVKERLVYISHCSLAKKDKKKVMGLAAQLNSISNVNICIDLCNQNEILNHGLAKWILDNLEKADKIIMVLTPLYLEAITLRATTENEFLKVNAETDLIRKLLYKNCQRSSQFAVILDRVRAEETPTEFAGRSQLSFPNAYNRNDKSWTALVGFVIEQNPFNLPKSSTV
ncbi:uncharacterized protein LOC100202417 isoform X2 [Hydra vulgaris]|uniref:uncharacterized protein LOC100202417 isoform X2 n=1 Tax=Hydra vulgaris TaxID=6087 RepID=UPI001F5F82E0|nr:uncharacterized protein LOC100202417 isoform X2 [Hydra vulgaris]